MRLAAAWTLIAVSFWLPGCAQETSPAPAPPPPRVTASYPVEREVADFAETTGQTSAVGTVEVRARVWGYLDKVNFTEGALVKKGEVLIQIDPRPYKAALDQAKAKIAQDEAQRRYSEATYQRNAKLRSKGAVTQEDLDKSLADRDAAAATVAADRADAEQRQLDLNFTRVEAPITGRVGRAEVTEGNVVQSGQNGGTLLTTIVSVDPIYAYFDVDERTLLTVRRMIRSGEIQSARETTVAVFMGLADEEGYPIQGTINFVDNRVDPSTGTLRLRGVFVNPDGFLTPGLFVRIRLPIGTPHRSIMVAEQALGSDQGQKFVYVVNDQNEVAYRAVTTGRLYDGLRVVESGLATREKVIISGLQRVRPGTKVELKMTEMPTRSMLSRTSPQRTGSAAAN